MQSQVNSFACPEVPVWGAFPLIGKNTGRVFAFGHFNSAALPIN